MTSGETQQGFRSRNVRPGTDGGEETGGAGVRRLGESV